jgi:hypothetical protein
MSELVQNGHEERKKKDQMHVISIRFHKRLCTLFRKQNWSGHPEQKKGKSTHITLWSSFPHQVKSERASENKKVEDKMSVDERQRKKNCRSDFGSLRRESTTCLLSKNFFMVPQESRRQNKKAVSTAFHSAVVLMICIHTTSWWRSFDEPFSQHASPTELPAARFSSSFVVPLRESCADPSLSGTVSTIYFKERGPKMLLQLYKHMSDALRTWRQFCSSLRLPLLPFVLFYSSLTDSDIRFD